MKNSKIYWIISMVVIILSIVTLLLMVIGKKTIITCSFFIFELFSLLLVGNVASYLTTYLSQRKQLKKKNIIFTCIFLIINIMSLLIYLYFITISYLFN